MTGDVAHGVLEIARRAKGAARRVAALDAQTRRQCLSAMADGIDTRAEAILAANAGDMEDARRAGLAPAMVDRLMLNPERISAMSRAVKEIAAQSDPLAAVLETIRRPNGLVIEKVRVPIGVVAIIYESRPNVTADAAALCLKSGNACILRGGSESIRSNRAILEAMMDGARKGGAAARVPDDAIQMIPTADRAAVNAMLKLDQFIDLVVPRGGESLIRAVAENSRVPVLKHYKGVCHVYVDEGADLEMALSIAVNAKCQRPGVCNAMETLLVHERVAEEFLPRFWEATRKWNLDFRADDAAGRILKGAKRAAESDWSTEWLDYICGVRVVGSLDGAIDHIETYGTRHSDAIVTRDQRAAERFLREVDSATVYVNASTRFTDGAEFGKGAEVGISTDKLHARGPCGVEELTTYKYVIRGTGQVRG